jgi:hypothetical protein
VINMSWLKKAAAVVGVIAGVLLAAVAVAFEIVCLLQFEGALLKGAVEVVSAAASLAGNAAELVANTAQASLQIAASNNVARTATAAVHTAARVVANAGMGVNVLSGPVYLPNPGPIFISNSTHPLQQQQQLPPQRQQQQQRSPVYPLQQANMQAVRSPDIGAQLRDIENALRAHMQQPGYNPLIPLPISASDPHSQKLHEMVCKKLEISAIISVAGRNDIPAIPTDNKAEVAKIKNDIITYRSKPGVDLQAPMAITVHNPTSQANHIKACQELGISAAIKMSNSSAKPIEVNSANNNNSAQPRRPRN